MEEKKIPCTFKIFCTDGCGAVLGTQTIELTATQAKTHDTKTLGSLCDDCAKERTAKEEKK